MLNIALGIFIVLHGLVHLWYVTLSARLVEFQPQMGWTGASWLLPGTLEASVGRPLAAVLFAAATTAFAVSGASILAGADWTRPLLLAAAVVSSIALLMFWDGGSSMLVEKGVLGLIINAAIIAALLLWR